MNNFDYEFYISKYEDLKHLDSYEKAYKHYINHGIYEGRNGDKNLNENFDWVFYTTFYNDLSSIKSKDDAFSHYLTKGILENRIYDKKIYDEFDHEFYKSIYNDLQNLKNKKEIFNHYIHNGIRELRICDKEIYNNFDWIFYLTFYDDIKMINNKKDAFNHYINYGIKENRIYDKSDYKYFDWEFYLEINDNIKIINKNEDEALKHYIQKGHQEHRICNKNIYNTFDWKLYLELYPELIENGLNNQKDAFLHYYKDKKTFQGKMNNIFDWEEYLDTYPDLKKIIKNSEQAYIHYISAGKNENRKINKYEQFDWKFYKFFYNLHNIHLKEDALKHYIDNKYINTIINNNIYNSFIEFDYIKYLKYYSNKKLLKIIKNIKTSNINESFLLENDCVHSHFNGSNWNNILSEYKKIRNYIINLDIEYENIIKFNDNVNILHKEKVFKYWYLYGKKQGHIYFSKNLDVSNDHIDKKIGIAISVYSDENTPKERILCSKICINSIVTQCNNIIVIVIDGNIVDEHLQFIKDLIENRKNIFLYINAKNYGIAKTKNICIKLLEKEKVEHICLLDDDIEIIKNFSKYIINIFDKINIPLLSNYNNELDYEEITNNEINFIKTKNYYGNFIVINGKYLPKLGYFAKFESKWGEEHVEITKRYLKNTEYENYAVELKDYIKNEQIIDGKSTLHMHSAKNDENKNKNKEEMKRLLKNVKYIDFQFNINEVLHLNYIHSNILEETFIVKEKEENICEEQQENICEKQEENICEKQEENICEKQEENILEEIIEENILEKQKKENVVEEIIEKNILEKQKKENVVEEIIEKNILEEQEENDVEENILEKQKKENVVEEIIEENILEKQKKENVVEKNVVEKIIEKNILEKQKKENVVEEIIEETVFEKHKKENIIIEEILENIIGEIIKKK